MTTDDGGFTDTCVVTVTEQKEPIAVTGIELNRTALTLEEGKTQYLFAYVEPLDADEQSVLWISDDEDIATVSSYGLVTAIKEGKTTITATTVDGGFAASCTVTVIEKENFSYSLGDTSVEIVHYESSFLSSDYIRVITPVKNDGNVNIGLSWCSYDILTSGGDVVASLSQYNVKNSPDILKPGETGYFSVILSYDEGIKEDLVAVPHPDIRNARTHDAVRYDLSNVSFSKDNYGEVFARGIVTNNNETAASSSDKIDIFLFDKQGDFLVCLSTYLEAELASGESRAFEASNLRSSRLGFDVSDIGSYVAYAYREDFVYNI